MRGLAWWKRSLFDTCSLISLDKLLLERKSLSRIFPKSILALEQSFSEDQMRKQTATRVRRLVTIQELPSAKELALVFSSGELSTALSEVDKLVYATSAHFKLSVVTADRRLGRAVREAGLDVTDMASVLRELVQTNKLSADSCMRLLQGLADRNDLLLGTPNPTWPELQAHSFPDRKKSPRK